MLEKCIQSSVQAEFDKSIQALKESTNGVPKDSDWIVQVSGGTSKGIMHLLKGQIGIASQRWLVQRLCPFS